MIKVRMVQIGITTRCNSNCYFCFRKELQRRYGFYEKKDLPVDGIKRLIEQGIRDIHLCGNRGEALYHPNIEEILDLILSNECRFEMNTNGGRFDTNWWYDLGQKMKEHDEVVFALDGLKNSHEYYRKTKWTQVFDNMKSFIKGGGNAVWQMIVFEHNEGQVNLIKNLAKEIGCRKTWILNSRLYNKVYKKPSKKIYNKTKTEIIRQSENHNIRCKFFHGERVYVDVHGKVWPCCYTKCHFGFPFRFKNNPKGSKGSIRIIADNEKRNILNTPINEIVNDSELFKRVFDTMYLPYDKSKGNWMINYACHLHCNDTEEMNKNRRIN